MKRNAYAALGWVVWKVGRPLLRREFKRDRDPDDADETSGPLRTLTEPVKRRTRARRRTKAAKRAARPRKAKGDRP